MEIDPNLAFAVPLIVATLQLLKTIPPIAKYTDWFPLLSLALGILVGFACMGDAWYVELIAGWILGAAAAGTYNGLRNTAAVLGAMDSNKNGSAPK